MRKMKKVFMCIDKRIASHIWEIFMYKNNIYVLEVNVFLKGIHVREVARTWMNIFFISVKKHSNLERNKNRNTNQEKVKTIFHKKENEKEKEKYREE